MTQQTLVRAARKWARTKSFAAPPLQRLDRREIPRDKSEIRLFMVIRNEHVRLPYFFDYYRARGVDRFFAVDNGSDDGGREFLLSQSDTHVFYTEESYQASDCGVDWTRWLLSIFGRGQWCLALDADEFLVYPECESQDIRQLTQLLDRRRATALGCFLLDMYPEVPLLAIPRYDPGSNPLETCPYFDADTHIVSRASNYPIFEDLPFYHGGVRRRTFGRDPCLNKYPLFKHDRFTHISIGAHWITNARIAEMFGCLLHFKFLSDFSRKVQDEIERHEHWDGGADYDAYSRQLAANPQLNMHTSESVKYRDSCQLVQLGLMRPLTQK